MSFYGINSFTAGLPVDSEKLEVAETESTLLQNSHQSIIDGCKEKCFVPYYTEAELSKGESACVDRCSSKFFQANIAIGEHMKKLDIKAEQITAPSSVMPSLGQHSTLAEKK